MSTVGPTHADNNEDLTIGKNRPNKPLPTPPSETEMTAPQNLAPKKPLPKIVESDAEYTGEIETFEGAQGFKFDEDTEESPSARSSQQLIQKGTGQVFERQYVVKEHKTDSQQQKSFSLINSLKSFTTMVSNSRVGKFFSEIGPKIKASAFGTAIRGVFTKREEINLKKVEGELKTILSSSEKPVADRFRQILKDPKSSELLKAYCKSNHQMDTFNFMVAFITIEKAPNLQSVSQIKRDFIDDESKQQINIDHKTKTSLLTAIENKQITQATAELRTCFITLCDTLNRNINTKL